jgi:hypothetical protein
VKSQDLVDMFESYGKVLTEPGDDARYMVINVQESDPSEVEIEFFSERPKSVMVGGDAGNWPKNYQVWELIEEQETQ